MISSTSIDYDVISECKSVFESISFKNEVTRTSVLDVVNESRNENTKLVPGMVLVNKLFLSGLNFANINTGVKPGTYDLVKVIEVVNVGEVVVGIITDNDSNQRIHIDPENSSWVPLDSVGRIEDSIFIPSVDIARRIDESEKSYQAKLKSRNDLKVTLFEALKGDTVDWQTINWKEYFDIKGYPQRAKDTFERHSRRVRDGIISERRLIDPFKLRKGNVVAYLDSNSSPTFAILEFDPVTTKDNKINICKFKFLIPGSDYIFSETDKGFSVFNNAFPYNWEGNIFTDITALNEEYKKLGERIAYISRKIKDGILSALHWK